VSFDTFSNPAASDFSLTLHRKHQDYVYTKRSRTFLCGTDTNEYSDTALEWLIDELVDDGDEVVCLRVVEKDSKEATRWAGGQGEKGYRDEAQRFLEAIERKNTDDRAISLVLEFSIGKVHDTIQQMIRIYEPAILVVGTRGRSLTGYHGLLSSGSISKYCLQYSPVPVIVVRPSSKREAKKRKRLQDPTRSGYRDILDKSEEHHRGRGGHLLDKSNRSSLFGPDLGALGEFNSAGDPDDEARRVAEAVGWHRGSRPGTASDGRSSSQTRQSAARAEASPAPNDRLLMSPDPNGRTSFGNSSPDSSESDDDDEANAPHHLRSQPHRRAPDEDEDYQDEDDDIVYEDLPLRPQDEAAIKAYEAGVRNAEDVREEAAAAAAKLKQQQDRSASRNGTRGRGRSEREEEGGGAAVLGLLAQLDRGMR
jgi:nucleotide-binding universal stress UspA family protein